MALVKGLSTINTRSPKKLKFKSAQEKREYESYMAWKDDLKKSLKPAPAKPARLKADYSHVRETAYIPSLDTGDGQTAKKESRKYEGERQLLGIGQMHKSNAIPIFDEDSAREIARMRRG